MKTSFTQVWLRTGWVATLAVSLCLVAGCGGGSKKPGKVTGKVTYNGETLGGGNVTFQAAEGHGQPTKTPINAQGSYEFTDLAPGEYFVGVETESVKQFAGGKAYNMPQPPGAPVAEQPKFDNMPKYVAIPVQYQDPKNSGLPKITVVKGSNPPQNIDLPKK